MSLPFWGSGLAKSIWASIAQTVFKIMEMDETTQEESLRKEVLCLNPGNSNIERVKRRVASKGDVERITKGVKHSLKISMLLVEICKRFNIFYTHTYIFILPSPILPSPLFHPPQPAPGKCITQILGKVLEKH